MNTYMNDKIVETVKAKMKNDGITQEALANRLGMARTNLVRLVNGHVGSVPKRWQDVLNELGLELIAVPKNADVSESEQKTPPVETVTKAIETRSEVSQKGIESPVKRAASVEIPPEVEELRRRWKAGEFKGKDVSTPSGVWFAGQAHKELGYLFQALKHRYKTRREPALGRLMEVAAANPREEA